MNETRIPLDGRLVGMYSTVSTVRSMHAASSCASIIIVIVAHTLYLQDFTLLRGCTVSDPLM